MRLMCRVRDQPTLHFTSTVSWTHVNHHEAGPRAALQWSEETSETTNSFIGAVRAKAGAIL